MAKRKAIPKKVRFEVLKRDKFTCRYCGAKSPDVVLHIDHITPVSKGGTNDIMNLVASCSSCNLGKGARTLDDQSVVRKRRAEAELSQDRMEQLEMLHQWHIEMQQMADKEVDMAVELFLSPPYMKGLTINDNGRNRIRRLIFNFGISEVMAAIGISLASYIKIREGEAVHDSVAEAFGKLGGICYNRRKEGKLNEG